ncbi:endo-1,3-alpha-glucanase family glycosylhydrolase [Rhodococcus sp. ARC_M6]|uniref:endo-1,3-alpha-glucanase family glycosylhydrolase n=1 Tax=Rhodococcus sp. ARC_M6 TaxID=2928852 RepID=UPI002436B177|nr:endo-1,3-alpha-glucanase family glycosylhydrolase [Rhodococcus sp. ARC_M6]
MKGQHGVDVALVPVFLDAAAYQDEFAPISYGMSNWGNRSPATNLVDSVGPGSSMGAAAEAHDLGKIWMQPVSFQDVRPSQSIFDEAENSRNLRDTWKIALESDSDWVQLTTWNDYSEGTSFASSAGHGRALLDLNAYWLYWFRTGTPPKIVRDTAYLVYRSHPISAVPVNPSSAPMTLRDGSSPARDIIEVVTVLTEAATVAVTVGTTTAECRVPAGIGSCVVPLEVGTIVVTVIRGRDEVARVASHRAVTAAPFNQNLEYLVDSSRR